MIFIKQVGTSLKPTMKMKSSKELQKAQKPRKPTFQEQWRRGALYSC